MIVPGQELGREGGSARLNPPFDLPGDGKGLREALELGEGVCQGEGEVVIPGELFLQLPGDGQGLGRLFLEIGINRDKFRLRKLLEQIPLLRRQHQFLKALVAVRRGDKQGGEEAGGGGEMVEVVMEQAHGEIDVIVLRIFRLRLFQIVPDGRGLLHDREVRFLGDRPADLDDLRECHGKIRLAVPGVFLDPFLSPGERFVDILEHRFLFAHPLLRVEAHLVGEHVGHRQEGVPERVLPVHLHGLPEKIRRALGFQVKGLFDSLPKIHAELGGLYLRGVVPG